ncbi:hypothetical protein QGN23_01075 [Chryseobacterium gotjawalense]|uniref:XRE family transcriptional regulator n=1 Tax=Chryseobacterium gotjawalense TaxID=3042315 RepID=A0ABY8RD25_9FLAO|nr:hypothetical protein [Chryseobacterium sp. wdc7]WHF51885.1 hypothetical protein QGN23_01075 [Chryseobacterium sp. wdc7]
MSDSINKKVLENFSRYIVSKKKELGLSNERLAKECNISNGEISKLITMERKSISPKTFYLIYTGVKDNFSNIFTFVYEGYEFSLNKYVPKKRSELGHIIMKYETQKNNIEKVSAKTGIPLTRLKNLYYTDISFTTEEIILIEMSLKLKGGEIFEELYGKP